MHLDETTLPDRICRGEEALVRQLVQEGKLSGQVVEYAVKHERKGFRRLVRGQKDQLGNDLMSEDDVNASVFLLRQPTVAGLFYRAIVSRLESASPVKSWHDAL